MNRFINHIEDNGGDTHIAKMIWILIAFVVGAIIAFMLFSSARNEQSQWFTATLNSWLRAPAGYSGKVEPAGDDSGHPSKGDAKENNTTTEVYNPTTPSGETSTTNTTETSSYVIESVVPMSETTTEKLPERTTGGAEGEATTAIPDIPDSQEYIAVEFVPAAGSIEANEVSVNLGNKPRLGSHGCSVLLNTTLMDVTCSIMCYAYDDSGALVSQQQLALESSTLNDEGRNYFGEFSYSLYTTNIKIVYTLCRPVSADISFDSTKDGLSISDWGGYVTDDISVNYSYHSAAHTLDPSFNGQLTLFSTNSNSGQNASYTYKYAITYISAAERDSYKYNHLTVRVINQDGSYKNYYYFVKNSIKTGTEVAVVTGKFNLTLPVNAKEVSVYLDDHSSINTTAYSLSMIVHGYSENSLWLSGLTASGDYVYFTKSSLYSKSTVKVTAICYNQRNIKVQTTSYTVTMYKDNSTGKYYIKVPTVAFENKNGSYVARINYVVST